MFSAFKRLGADSLLYAFMNVGTKLIAFLMLPIYTSYLSKAQYGAVYLIDQWTSMLTFLVIFGTDSALSFYYYDTDDKEKRLLYVRNVMYFRLFVVGLLFLAVVLAGPWIAGALFQEPRYVDLLYISIATLLLDTIFVMATTVLRFEFQTKKVVIWTLVKMLLVAVLSYAALRWFAATPEGLLIGRLVSSALVFLLMLHLTVKYMVWRVRFDVLKELLAYAAPLVPTSLAFWVIANVSTFFIQRFASLEEVGVFGVALRLATVITLITSGVQMAWRPYSMSMKDRSESRALFAKVYMALLLIGAFGLLLIATASPWLVATFFKPEYRDAASYIPFLSAVTFLNFYYLIVSTGLFLTKETGYISRVFTLAALLHLALNAVLVPLWLSWGAIAASLMTYMAAVAFIFRKSQQVYPVPVSWKKMALVLSGTLLALIVIVYVQQAPFADGWVLAGWGLFAATLFASRVDRDLRRPVRTIEGENAQNT
ncbi:oligosaccharide flippase family protein [Geobacillus thermocatenulatus]|uniref:lipopolysaccharide biosynthesis protein n=1 Tax=Geobacillus thermocatenulatus TaxID=33938 RepID=UPI003D1E694A